MDALVAAEVGDLSELAVAKSANEVSDFVMDALMLHESRLVFEALVAVITELIKHTYQLYCRLKACVRWWRRISAFVTNNLLHVGWFWHLNNILINNKAKCTPPRKPKMKK